jgi:hypothetical protein
MPGSSRSSRATDLLSPGALPRPFTFLFTDFSIGLRVLSDAIGTESRIHEGSVSHLTTGSTALCQGGGDSLSLFGFKVGTVKMKKQQPLDLGRASTGMVLQ